MTPGQLFADIETGCVVEVPAAASSFYDPARGLTVRQSFHVYPDDTVVALNYCDGSYTAITLVDDDDIATFFHRYLRPAQAA